MNKFGKSVTLISLALLVLASSAVSAAITASVDRDRIAMGDTLRLTITATEDENTSNLDLRPLSQDFALLQRSTSSNTTVTNGVRTHTRNILVDITPKREGTLRIPPLRIGREETNMILVAVSAAPKTASDGQTVVFEAEVDKQSVYVQGQLVLTLRVQQSINLDSRSITELAIEDAFVKPLEQRSFQRTSQGRPWLVHEVRYAIFPEKSGTLTIPPQSFTARESSPRSSLFDLNSGGRQLRRTSEALEIEVLPRPTRFPSPTWLPTRKLTLDESWSVPPEQLRAGESATRTITIEGEGLQGAQLPPILFTPVDGLKYYPDQPVIQDLEVSTGLQGNRRDSAALVATRPGNWTIPEIKIPWWDTEAETVRYATLPARKLNVAAGDSVSSLPTTVQPIDIGNPTDLDSPIQMVPAQQAELWPWQLLTALSILGWVLTTLVLLRHRSAPGATKPLVEQDPTEQKLFKQLTAACAGSNGALTRQYMVSWCDALFSDRKIVSLDQVSAAFADSELTELIDQLNRDLYSNHSEGWDGSALKLRCELLRKLQRDQASRSVETLSLYPATTRS